MFKLTKIVRVVQFFLNVKNLINPLLIKFTNIFYLYLLLAVLVIAAASNIGSPRAKRGAAPHPQHFNEHLNAS